MLGRVRTIYESVPALRGAIGRSAGLLPPSVRFGSAYRETAKLLAGSASWPAEAIERESLARLRAVLNVAGTRVPYYRELFARIGFDPGDVTCVHDIECLPLLTRQIVREQGLRLVAQGLPASSYRYQTTGGTSSGEPLGFYISHAASAAEWAFITNMWSRAGYDPSAWRAVLRGRAVDGRTRGRLWEVDHLTKAVVFSTFDMNEANLDRYVSEIDRRGIPFIHAYPSSALTLAQYLEATGRKLTLRAWLLGSEELTAGQRAYIEEVSGAPVFSWYGHSEKCVIAAECGDPGAFLPHPLYGYTELTRPNGSPITGTGERGAITGTGYITGATIFIRYATDDTAEWVSSDCGCGSHGMCLGALEGRAHEALHGRTGVRISLVSMNLHSSVYARLERFRFVQCEPGRAQLFYVPRAGFTVTDLAQLRSELSAKLDGEIELDYRRVDELPSTAAGKFRYIDQRIEEPVTPVIPAARKG